MQGYFRQKTPGGRDAGRRFGSTSASGRRDRRKNPEFKAKASIATGEEKCYTGEPIRAQRFAPGWLLDDGHEYVRRALAGLQKAGLSPELSHYAFCTNGSYYAGVAGIPTIGFGASKEELAHVIDEYVEIEQLAAACRGYYAISAAMLDGSC